LSWAVLQRLALAGRSPSAGDGAQGEIREAADLCPLALIIGCTAHREAPLAADSIAAALRSRAIAVGGALGEEEESCSTECPADGTGPAGESSMFPDDPERKTHSLCFPFTEVQEREILERYLSRGEEGRGGRIRDLDRAKAIMELVLHLGGEGIEGLIEPEEHKGIRGGTSDWFQDSAGALNLPHEVLEDHVPVLLHFCGEVCTYPYLVRNEGETHNGAYHDDDDAHEEQELHEGQP
jgi:hypothetical protein